MGNVFKTVRVSELEVDKYQRDYSKIIAKAKQMAANYQPDLIGAIKVSLRNGKYFVIDGQHRLVATKLKGIYYIMCEILTEKTFEQESTLFVDLSRSVKRITQHQEFKAKMLSGDQNAIDLNGIVEKNGYNIIGVGEKDYITKILALKTLESITLNHGLEHLDHVLSLISRCWISYEKMITKNLMLGISLLISDNASKFNDSFFIAKLSKIAVQKIIMEAGSDISNTKESAIAAVLKKYYNKGLIKCKI